jgi:hypothetical protein
MTIHRAFRLLDKVPEHSPGVEELFGRLTGDFALTIVTTNWDIMAERCLQRRGIDIVYEVSPDVRHPEAPRAGLPVWRLHGSGNWGYCDLCRNLITSELDLGKIAVRFQLLLEAEDFKLFRGGARHARNLDATLRACPWCGGRVAVRVATFSYRKHLEPSFFYSIWDSARNSLSQADRWLFVGYSLPEADIEIRQLLKTAELASPHERRPRIDVVLKRDDGGRLRYDRLFGRSVHSIDNRGLATWINSCLPNY